MNLDKNNFPGIKLYPQEHIVEIQRQHWIVLIAPLLFNFLLGISLPSFIFIITVYYKNILSDFVFSVCFFSALLGTAFLIAFSANIFLRWYYQFYIITNKRIIHIHFFRLGGFHLDEVFRENNKPLEIDKNTPNMLFDFFGIEDVYVYFNRLQRPEAFIFKTPQDAEKIEELLEGHTMEAKNQE